LFFPREVNGKPTFINMQFRCRRLIPSEAARQRISSEKGAQQTKLTDFVNSGSWRSCRMQRPGNGSRFALGIAPHVAVHNQICDLLDLLLRLISSLRALCVFAVRNGIKLALVKPKAHKFRGVWNDVVSPLELKS
jgi:hypothetical protein